MGNELFVLVDWRDVWVTSQVIIPILTKNGLMNKTFARRRIYKYWKQKVIQLIYKVTYDFIKHPVFTLRGLFYMLKSYPNLKKGTEEYLDLRQLFDSKIDLIHSPFSTPEILDKIYFMSKSMNVPYTLSFRAHDIYKNDVRCEIQKRTEVIQGASHIITISSFNKNTLKTNLQINKDIDIIHGCINTDLFKPAKESKSNRSIITVCRLDEQKGLIYLLEACHILNQRNIEYDCTIIGEGPEKTRYEKYIDELKIPNVNIVDFMMQDDICKHLNRSAVFVLPCIVSSDGRRDILANVLKEAMAMELPVVTSNISGIEELVEDGINGILVPPKNPEAIAEAILKLFSNCDLRIKMGKEARKKVQRDFNVKNEVRKLEDIFNKIVNKQVH